MSIGATRNPGAVKVTTYNPTFHVLIHLPYANGTITGELDSNDPSNLLKESIYSINTGRQIGDMAEWSIVLYPTTNWDQIIPLMSFVVISLTTTGTDNIVMRGFVTSINRTFSIQNGQPREFITITGSDWQKIAMYPIYYLMNANSQSSPIPLPINIINTWLNATNSLSLLRPIQLMQGIFNGFFSPMLSAFTNSLGLSTTIPGLPNNIGTTQVTLSTADAEADSDLENHLNAITPVVEARGASNIAPNTTIWEIFQQYQAAPWRELFFDDYPQGQLLIYRSTPWRDINGNFIAIYSLNKQIFNPIVITSDQVMTYSITRCEANVYNAFLTYETFDEPFVQIRKTFGITNGNPALVGVTPPNNSTSVNTPSSWQTFGIRFLEERTPYLGFNSSSSGTNGQNQLSSQPANQAQSNQNDEFSIYLNQRLYSAFSFNDLLESGTVTINGSPTIHIGSYIYLQKVPNETPQLYYVEGVNHTFVQPSGTGDGQFLTSLSLTRGEGYLQNYYKTQNF